MILQPNLISNLIRENSDEKYIGFKGFPTTTQEAAIGWSDKLQAITVGILPVVNPTIAEVAKNVSIPSFMAAFTNPAFEQLFANAFMQYATTLATGMQPTFTGIPPVIPIDFKPAFAIGLAGGSAKDCADMMANIIFVWFTSGRSVNNQSGAVIPWS